jgi:hypothetical protein
MILPLAVSAFDFDDFEGPFAGCMFNQVEGDLRGIEAILHRSG